MPRERQEWLSGACTIKLFTGPQFISINNKLERLMLSVTSSIIGLYSSLFFNGRKLRLWNVYEIGHWVTFFSVTKSNKTKERKFQNWKKNLALHHFLNLTLCQFDASLTQRFIKCHFLNLLFNLLAIAFSGHFHNAA